MNKTLNVMKNNEILNHSEDDKNLTVSVKSFSYKKGFPHDESGHGGGFVFDCRALPNPYDDENLRPHTGKDKDVAEFLSSKPQVADFLDLAEKLVSMSIKEYPGKNYNHLEVCFGCTGGHHRSVYSAERMAEFLGKTFKGIKVELRHTALENSENS